eukprot:GFUD01002520.1.p1 GENE.GFUD01002520.1~~GFUD01002520.1.p1  ORF type:complete len:224 (-),score=55.91 GFUD01002520.1:8-679(-)
MEKHNRSSEKLTEQNNIKEKFDPLNIKEEIVTDDDIFISPGIIDTEFVDASQMLNVEINEIHKEEIFVKEEEIEKPPDQLKFQLKTIDFLRSVPQGVPHVCDECGKAFTKISRLNEHQICHRPIHCKFCDKEYRSYSGLRSHVASVHDNTKFICQTCQKMFKSPENLKCHQKKNKCFKEMNAKPFPCNQCWRKFKSNKCLAVHIKTKHAENEEDPLNLNPKPY